jgi:hypothetical protein
MIVASYEGESAPENPSSVVESFSSLALSAIPEISDRLHALAEFSNSDRSSEQRPSRHSRTSRSGSLDSDAPVLPANYDIRGTPRETESLDPRYKQQKHPKEYFVYGKSSQSCGMRVLVKPAESLLLTPPAALENKSSAKFGAWPSSRLAMANAGV